MKKCIRIVISLVLMISLMGASVFASSEPVFSGGIGYSSPLKSIIKPLDVQPSWKENVEMRLKTSQQFRVRTVSIVAIALAGKFGGTKGFWTALAGNICATSYTVNNGNIFEDIRYYWRVSGDPQRPYYIKQVVYCYADSKYKKFIGLETRYYYSTQTF